MLGHKFEKDCREKNEIYQDERLSSNREENGRERERNKEYNEES